MRTIDWAKTAVGGVEAWPQSLRTALSILLETGFPMYIAWGPEFTQFYNDGYRPILGSTKHPAAMGSSTRESFAEIWDIIGPMFRGVLEGTATTVVDFLLPLDRHGFVEECYFIFSYSPIREEGGKVGGVLVTVTETTQRMLGERRLRTSQALAAQTRNARTVEEACALAGRVLRDAAADLPAFRIYLFDALAQRARLVESGGHDATEHLVVDVDGAAHIDDLGSTLGAAAPDPGRVIVLPIVQPGSEGPIGALVAGCSARLRLDEPYKEFVALLASQIGTAIASARVLEEAQARAESLAALDRAKTAFFSNISHEFRTPLALMLGPTEDALAAPEQSLAGQDLETVHRNQLRLLKLVNTLLDFARIEAGRVDAAFEATDLAALTSDLVSAFRSAIERAGLTLDVDCPPLPAPVFVDREMWEKIVLNLLSNALKFTFAGSIGVSLRWRENAVSLRVSDTGTGIGPADLERVFERFHRGERTRGRTQEGSGIGLALVRELVNMHGGAIRAQSELGVGTAFEVTLPTGSSHLPPEQIVPDRLRAPTAAAATPYVQEASRWIPGVPAPVALPGAGSAFARPTILVADDNADMREYLSRLLAPRWEVDAVGDVEAALRALERRAPDVVLSDIMMPGRDGFELLAAVRSNPETRSIPVILLSARAGEEARIEGLRAGADDYLVKPFSARELIARVDAQLLRAQVRSVEEAHALRLASVFALAPVGVAILRGRRQVVEFANQAYLELVGNRPLVEMPLQEALPELAGQGIHELLDRVYTTGQPHVGRSQRVDLRRRQDELEARFFDFVYQPLFDEHDSVTGIAVVAFDVSELTNARRDAEAASRAKDEFLAMLGHELRNPLAPILTALQLMELRGVTDADRERAIIERQVRHMVRLVDDLLDVSRITRGKVQLRRERVELADAVAKAVEMTSPAIEERRHELEVRVPRGLVVIGDLGRLAQVFGNLLNNAAKYTDAQGRIEIVGSHQGTEALLRVRDNGSGIEPNILPHVFALFYQERQSIERSQGGLGLGLAIVRNLIEAHGGTVSAESAGRGEGAEFSVRLPLATPEVALGAPVAGALDERSATTGRRILVVDDNSDAGHMLADSLRELGHCVDFALDGPSALVAARRLRPHLVLLDLGLPVMDGFEVAARLRDEPEMRDTTLVAVTGYGQELDRQRTRDAGFDTHLVKPVELTELQAVLASLSHPD